MRWPGGRDARWTALDARHLYQHAKAAGSIYQAHLRAAVRDRMPWASWGTVRNGMAELEQVPEPVLEEFSTRRRRILARAAEHSFGRDLLERLAGLAPEQAAGIVNEDGVSAELFRAGWVDGRLEQLRNE